MFGLDTDDLRHIKNCFSQLPKIEKVLIYGSRAKGNYKKGSDIDITLLGKDLTLDDTVYPLLERLEALCLPYTFDISIFETLDNLEFIRHILRVGKTFYEKEHIKLPDGWVMKTLGEVCEKIFAGGDKPKEFSKFKTEKFNIPIYANGEKNKGLYGYTNEAKVLDPSITISGRGTIGYSEIRNEPFTPIVRLIVLKPKRGVIDIEFLENIISNLDFINSGSSIPQLTVPMVKGYNIPLPPLPQQKQIVAILDKVFAAIDTAKANAEQNLQNAKELFESYLQKVFSNGKLKVDSGEWEEKTLGEVCSKIGSGATPRGGKASYKEEGFSLIRSMNVHDFHFKEKNLAFIDDQQANGLSNVTIQEEDILLNITGASIARCCIVPKEYLPARVNQHVSIIRAKKGFVTPVFLASLLTSKYFKDQILEIGEQGATRQAITKVQLENFVISFPPIEKQKQIVKKLEALSAETRKLEAIYTQKITDLEEMKKSVLQKAFSGQLL